MTWFYGFLGLCCIFMTAVQSQEGKKIETIEGRLGEKEELNFPLSDLRDEYNNYIAARDGKKFGQNEIHIQNLTKSDIRFKERIYSTTEQIIFKDGILTDQSADSRTEIFLTNDAFVVRKTELQREDAGIYWIEFKSILLGMKYLKIADPENEPLRLMSSEMNILIVAVVIVTLVTVIVVGVIFTMYKKYGKPNKLELNTQKDYRIHGWEPEVV